MKTTHNEFIKSPNKAITLLGMSGIGKTTLANKLPKSQWFHYSGDYRIGTKYLEEPILDNIKEGAMEIEFLADLLKTDSIYISSNITVDNLLPISMFLGKIGNPKKGGLSLDEFLKRQKMHKDAEIKAMMDVPEFIEKSRRIYEYDHFINDAGGSICELNDTEAMSTLINNTLILYIEDDDNIRDDLIQRARENPKPMYYTEEFLLEHLEYYANETGERDQNINPNNFVRWVFPKLLDYRKNKYEIIAKNYGYRVKASEIALVEKEIDFIELVAKAIKSNE
jgi:GTPase SAR1 family protein